MFRCIAWFVAFLFFAPLTEAADGKTAARAVLVTGASTGIGRRITEQLSAAGFHVYAGARKDADLAALNRLPNVEALRLDVTVPQDIAAAEAHIRNAGRGLYALVNNAGVAIAGPLMISREEDFDFVLDVNVRGPYRMAKAFTPLLAANRGRIVNIGSISGTLSSGSLGVYSMSKHALEAFTDSLASELQPQGITVLIVEPGNYNSAIARSAATRQTVPQFVADRGIYKDPVEVADVVAASLTEETPKRRYMITPTQAEAEATIRKAIAETVQLNEGHAHTYSRDELVAMLDEALSKARPKVVVAR